MKRLFYGLMAIPMWSMLFLVLGGAEGSCGAGSVCVGLSEQECLASQQCKAVYLEFGGMDYLATRCAGGVRCVSEPVFDHCEDQPTCAGMGEQECLNASSCQTIYGYVDNIVYAGRDAVGGVQGAPCETGTRCVTPDQVFIECLDAGVDPCVGLSESECFRRPICEAEYQNTYCDPVWGKPGSVEPCSDGVSGYTGCHRRDEQCQTDSDCYNIFWEKGTANDAAYCQNSYTTCESGQCVYHCDDSCRTDADCAEGSTCQWRCTGACQPGEDCNGDNPCQGVCVPNQQGCRSDDECPQGQHCVFMPCDCLGADDPDCLKTCEQSGFCVPDQTGCQSDQDCPTGFSCDWYCTGACPPGAECKDNPCQGVCVPNQQGCQTNEDCPYGFACEIICRECDPNYPDCVGGCYGTCVQQQMGCQSDVDCAQGFTCLISCYDCPEGTPPGCNGGCYGECVPVNPGCQSDADCAAGERCEFPRCDCRNLFEDCTWCDYYEGTCVPVAPECRSDADCPAGQVCQFVEYCGPEYCGNTGICVPSHPGCETDAECGPGMFCDFGQAVCPGCPGGASPDCLPECFGTCMPFQQGCQSDQDCAAGEVCETSLLCYAEPCPSQCVAAGWMVFEPLQCQQTAWEIDAQLFPERYVNCGVDIDCAEPVDQCIEWARSLEEICQVRTYLQAVLGIAAHDIRDVQTNLENCEACGCPRGNTLYVLVATSNTEMMQRLGFWFYQMMK